MKKGLTIEERDDIKKDISLVRECRICKVEKPYMKFGSRNDKNGLIYFSYECHSCNYQRKLKMHEKNLTNYRDRQKYIENFTITGRACMLRNRCKQRSKTTGMEFSLTKNHIVKLLSDKICAKTNIELILDDSKYNPYAPSIDRIDNSIGYIDSNVQIVCMIYNFCKNSFSEEIVDDFFNKINK